MRGITAFALNNSRTVIMTLLLIILGGLVAFIRLPKLEDPLITIREALVYAKYPGMPVEQIERLITRPIEEEIRSMGEIDRIKDSTSKFGECLIHVIIKDEVPRWSTIPSAIHRWPPLRCGATGFPWRKCMKPPARSENAST
jgi:multidrug efflux pump subunit AcrB